MSFYLEEDKLFFNWTEIIWSSSETVPHPKVGMNFLRESCCNNYSETSISNYDFEKLNNSDFLEDFYISFFDDNSYLGLFSDIWKKNNIVKIAVPFLVSLSEWNEYFPLKSFLKDFPSFIRKKNEGEFWFSSDEFHFITYIILEVDCKKKINDFLNKAYDIYYDVYDNFINGNKIENSIVFSSEHLTAGSSILQYFGKLLQERYPNEKVSVSIKQEDLKVTMTIETPDGKKEEIEEYLNRYGLVITNQITPQEFTSNPIQLLELETKLESAKVEIGFQKKLLALKDKTYDENLVSLKDEVKFLRTELSSIQTSNNEQIKLFLSSLSSKDKLIKKLTKSIDKKDELETKQLLLELKDKDNNGYIGLKQHLDNAMIGGIVNAPSWIQFTMGIITKL